MQKASKEVATSENPNIKKLYAIYIRSTPPDAWRNLEEHEHLTKKPSSRRILFDGCAETAARKFRSN
jgi:hypothetical protein